MAPRKDLVDVPAQFNAGLRSVEIEATFESFRTASGWQRAVLLHEMHHAHHGSSTTNGFWLDLLDTVRMVALLVYLEGCREARHAVPHPPPLLEHPDLLLDRRERAFIDGRRLRSIWLSARTLERVLLGGPLASSLNTDSVRLYDAFSNVLAVLEFFGDGTIGATSRRALETMLSGDPHKRLAPRRLTFNPFGVEEGAIGYRAIIENASVVWTTILPDEMAPEIAMRSALNASEPDYVDLTESLLDAFGKASWKVFSQTVGAVFDLVLMSPPWPLAVPSFDCALSWEDIHPGHRMSRIRDALQRTPRLQLVENVERDYVPFINELCGPLQWPTPQQVANDVRPSIHALRMLGTSMHLDCFDFACLMRGQLPWTTPYPVFWELAGNMKQAPDRLKSVTPITAVTFADGFCHLVSERNFRERLEVQAWLWIGDQLLEQKGFDFKTCDFAGRSETLRQLAKSRVLSLLSGEAGGRHAEPLLSVQKYMR